MALFKVSITGGKGGTGKSTVAVNLAVFLSRKIDLVLADLDVEAPNDHILLGVELQNKEDVHVMIPFFNYEKCTKCGICADICDNGAIMMTFEKLPMLIPSLCSGCKACMYACRDKAIAEGRRLVGYTYRTEVNNEFSLVTGLMIEGEERAFPLVLAAHDRALSLNKSLLLVDTSAGSSNTVSYALEGSDLIIAVTEPTPLGASDLSLILELAGKIGCKVWVVINKAGIGSDDHVKEVISKFDVDEVFRVPYSREVAESYVKGKPLAILSPNSKPCLSIREIAEAVEEVV